MILLDKSVCTVNGGAREICVGASLFQTYGLGLTFDVNPHSHNWFLGVTLLFFTFDIGRYYK